MNSNNGEKKSISIFSKIKRKLIRFFLAQGSCSDNCEDCLFCPWIDKEKYSFEIKKRTEN